MGARWMSWPACREAVSSHVLVEDLANVHEVARAARRADAIEHVFGLGEGGLGVRVPLVADRRDLVGGPDEAAHDRGALDDAGIVLDVDGGGHGADEMGEVGRAADLFESLAENELLGDRHLVDGFAAVEQGKASLEAPAVLRYVEVLGGDDSVILGKASLSIRSAPMTDSSASTLCGSSLSV